MILKAQVRIRLKSGSIKEEIVNLPDDIVKSMDVIDDAVSDALDELGIEYRWYRLVTVQFHNETWI